MYYVSKSNFKNLETNSLQIGMDDNDILILRSRNHLKFKHLNRIGTYLFYFGIISYLLIGALEWKIILVIDSKLQFHLPP